MAFGAGSEIFTQFINTVMENFAAVQLSTDTCKLALYNDTTTPDQNAVVASTAYAVGAWVVGNEVTDATGWPATGNPLLTPTHVAGTALWTYDAPDLASLDSHTTITGTFGCLVYDDTLAAGCVDEGICYLSFGGTQSVSAGTFTVVFNASGIFAITL
jgi:hypothetical protein